VKNLFIFIAAITCWLGASAITSADDLPLPALLQNTRFITYTPRSFSQVNGKVIPATAAGIREDLTLLRPLFNGLITYSSVNGLEQVPALAHDQAFRAIIMGIWNPLSDTEIGNVIAAAKRYPDMVAAVIVGNEGIYTKRYQTGDVERAIQRIKRECPTLAVTTSEPFFLYFKNEYHDFFSSRDLLMPNVHPVFEPWFKPSEPSHGVDMVINVTSQFKATYRLPLLIKETGVPSGPANRSEFSPERQALFWSDLFKRFPHSPSLSFACFEAFDAPWKPAATAVEFPGNHASEAFWGFFTTQGMAKKVITDLPRLDH
jgi:exo-beta-1,3-glucanase (GH17 family)